MPLRSSVMVTGQGLRGILVTNRYLQAPARSHDARPPCHRPVRLKNRARTVNRSAGERRNNVVGNLMLVVDTEDRGAAEEAELVAQIAAGDIEAPMTELYRRYSRRLYRFGVQTLGNTGLAEDMVQEAFVKLWRTAGDFDAQRASVCTYLFVIARSTAADIRKRPSSRPLLPAEEADVPPEASTADQIIDGLIVHEALGTLSPAHLEVLRLAHDEDLTQSQIADRLGVPLGTVKTRMFHGMRALRTALAERGVHAA
jgi:RNA polymerase sigma-70 factor, ECF subfamily